MTESLSDDKQLANLKSCEQLIESVLIDRGLDVAGSRLAGDGGPAWGLTQGSAEVYVFLTGSQSNEENFIQVIAPVMTPSPEAVQDGSLYRRLLELNATELTGAAFGLREGEVVLTTDRSTTGLDRVEVEEMLQRVADYADHYDDILTVEFGGVRHSDT
jgi:hypothetical protein